MGKVEMGINRSMKLWLLALPFVLTSCDDLLFGGCDVRRDFFEEELVGSADAVRIEAKAGSLDVIGRRGLSHVRVTGDGCADDRGTADDIDLAVQRSGDGIRVTGIVPSDAQLDLVVEVPAEMAVDIEDTSGGIEVSNVRAASIDDRSGSIDIDSVDEDIEVVDTSGDLRVSDAGGDVRLRDGSGTIEVEGVNGTVQVEDDGSGDIFIRDVEGDVLIVEDGSGDIVVDTVGGDFIVHADGSGRISFRDVSGRIVLPD